MKRNNILKMGLSFAVLSCALFFTSCTTKNPVETDDHTHTYGEIKYVFSDDMTKLTATRKCIDSSCKSNITETVNVVSTISKEANCLEEGEIIYTSNNFTKEGFMPQTKKVKTNALGHNLIHYEKKEATCTEDGYEEYDVCTRCDYTTYKKIDKTGHAYSISYTWNDDNTKVTASKTCANNPNEVISEVATVYESVSKNATCTENGVKYLYAIFVSDDFAMQEKEVTIPALGHHEVTLEGKEATCSEAGYTEKVYCDRCNLVIKDRTDIPVSDHVYERIGAVEATCEHEGQTGNLECIYCHDLIEESETLPKTGHKEVIDEAVLPTCNNSTGKTEGSHCEYCGTVLKEQKEYTEVIPHNI